MTNKTTPVENDEIKKISIADLDTLKGGRMCPEKTEYEGEGSGSHGKVTMECDQ